MKTETDQERFTRLSSDLSVQTSVQPDGSHIHKILLPLNDYVWLINQAKNSLKGARGT